MTRRQKSAHKARVKARDWRTHGIIRDQPKTSYGDRVEIKDFSKAPAALESAMKAGRLRGVTAIYRLTGAEPGQWQLGMMNADMTIEEVFDLVCTMRRTMQQSYGFVDLADDRLMADVTDKTIEALHARIGDGLLLPRLLKELREATEWGGPIDKTDLPSLTIELAAALELSALSEPPRTGTSIAPLLTRLLAEMRKTNSEAVMRDVANDRIAGWIDELAAAIELPEGQRPPEAEVIDDE